MTNFSGASDTNAAFESRSTLHCPVSTSVSGRIQTDGTELLQRAGASTATGSGVQEVTAVVDQAKQTDDDLEIFDPLGKDSNNNDLGKRKE